MYIGLSAQKSISLCSQDEQLNMYTNFRNFYIEVISQIKKRFNFDDELFTILEIVDPKNAQLFSTKSLAHFKKRFPFVQLDDQKLDDEWRQHAFLDFKKHNLCENLDVETYWSRVFEIENCLGEPLFPNLRTVIPFLLILPFSNCSVERIFSKLKLTKTELRNKLASNTISSIFFTREGVEQNGAEKFEPSKIMLEKKYWN